MKLYEVPRNTRIRVNTGDDWVYLNFDHVDGIYSVCWTDNKELVHLAASADVEIVEEE